MGVAVRFLSVEAFEVVIEFFPELLFTQVVERADLCEVLIHFKQRDIDDIYVLYPKDEGI